MTALGAISAVFSRAVNAVDAAFAPSGAPAHALQIGSFDVELRQLLLAAAIALGLAALAWVVVVVEVLRKPGGKDPSVTADARALLLQSPERRETIGAAQVIAAGRNQGILLGTRAGAQFPLGGSGGDLAARLTRRGGLLFLTNLGQAGTIAIGDAPLPPNKPFQLQAGDRIRLGATEYVASVQ